MAQGSATSVGQLESMLREGRITDEEYGRLRDVMSQRQDEKRVAPSGRRIRKSWTDRELGGVCGGIARYFDVSSTRIRVAFLLLLLFTGGTAMWIYLALCLVLPWDEDERDLVRAGSLRFGTVLLALVLISFFAFFLVRYLMLMD